MLYDFGSSIRRGIGDSERPLYSLIAAGVVNTRLNRVLVIAYMLLRRKVLAKVVYIKLV